MPYRKLPNTDLSRINALETALERCQRENIPGIVIPTLYIQEMKGFLPGFKSAQLAYQQALDQQQQSSLKYQKKFNVARMYVSHFLQVFQFCILRKEFLPEIRSLYKLPIDSSNLPELSTEAQLLECCAHVIEGERIRTSQGGVPIYNPTIAKVNVHCTMFKETAQEHKVFQGNTHRTLEQLRILRPEADRLILNVWNAVETHFKHLEEKNFYQSCSEYGVRYYKRKAKHDD